MVSDKVITEEEEEADTRGVQHVISSSAGDAEREGCHHHPGAYLYTNVYMDQNSTYTGQKIYTPDKTYYT